MSNPIDALICAISGAGSRLEMPAPERASALDLIRHRLFPEPFRSPHAPHAAPTSPLACLAAAPATAAEAPIETGAPKPLPPLAFQTMDGQETTLAAFKGKVVVLNLWATWCAPCREEMPSLDRLQAQFADRDVIVLALSVDRAGPERVQQFLDEIGVKQVHVYRDPKAAATRAVKVPGLPATILVDRQGREAGRVLGIAHGTAPRRWRRSSSCWPSRQAEARAPRQARSAVLQRHRPCDQPARPVIEHPGTTAAEVRCRALAVAAL